MLKSPCAVESHPTPGDIRGSSSPSRSISGISSHGADGGSARIPHECGQSSMGVDHGGDEGDASPPTTEAGGMACTIIPPYKGDEQVKSILHNTPEEVVSYIDYEIIFSWKFE